MKYNRENYANAVYTIPENPIYMGNPLIEAVYENLPYEVIWRELAQPIPYEQDCTKLPPEVRSNMVSALQYYFVPWEKHIDLAEEIQRTIIDGYVPRNPFDKRCIAVNSQIRQSMQKKDASFENRAFRTANSGPTGFSVVGYSGMGKSCSIRNILNLIPQKIRHSKYEETDFLELQVTWMHIQCPHDASVKGLCFEFLKQFDKVVNDNLSEQFEVSDRVTVNRLITLTAQLARRYHLGVLVIDEIQNIRTARGKNQEEIIKFLLQVTNTIEIPIILVGTPPAIDVLQSDSMLSRRFLPKCVFDWLKKDEDAWLSMCKSLWQYQWTEKRSVLTREISEALHEVSFGVTDIAIKVVIEAQRLAISNGDEIVTPELIREVGKSYTFRPFRMRMERILKGDPSVAISGDCSIVAWNNLTRAADIQETLPQLSGKVALAEGKKEMKVSDAPKRMAKGKRKKSEATRKKATSDPDGYQSYMDRGMIGDLSDYIYGKHKIG